MKIISTEITTDESAPPRERETGIRRTVQGGWAAIKDGRLVRDFTGTGSKAKAIKAAGTNAVIA
jgi:hypothetical protein